MPTLADHMMNHTPQSSHDSTTDHDDAHLTESERSAMRAYLQRAEVRISTQHRIATAFIGGAGLLLLIPIFLRDIVDGEITVFLQLSGNLFPAWGQATGAIATAVALLTVGVPLVLSLVIPMYGVYLLLKDLVHFYFTLYMPGFDHDLLNPTFALGGINFSPDESQRAKRHILKFQYIPEHMDFMLPFSRGRRELYFDTLIKDTDGAVLPASRSPDRLRTAGVINGATTDDKTVEQFNAAFGLARALDRELVAEVAISEMHLVRNVLYLRRLMLRYVKTLLLFIWTTVISFIMLPMLRDERFPNLLILALGYVAWSAAVLPILRVPANWIYRHRYDDPEPRHMDTQLTQLETQVQPWVRTAVLLAAISLVLAVISTMQTG
jgi:hypothetical protein